MFWSQSSIPGKPRLLVVDSSRNAEGWESEFCNRIFKVLDKKGMQLTGDRPLRADYPEDLSEVFRDQNAYNCILLVGHSGGPDAPERSQVSDFWGWLSAYEGLTPKLLAICTCEDYDLDTSDSILTAEDSFAQFALAPQSPLSPRAAGLFFIKFFNELDLHAEDEITGKMVWFSRSKARELLRKRHLPGEIGMRC